LDETAQHIERVVLGMSITFTLNVFTINQVRLDNVDDTILQWLLPDMEDGKQKSKLDELLDCRLGNQLAGIWLLQDERFGIWLETPKSRLLCTGKREYCDSSSSYLIISPQNNMKSSRRRKVGARVCGD
jgi:hypothetical protein